MPVAASSHKHLDHGFGLGIGPQKADEPPVPAHPGHIPRGGAGGAQQLRAFVAIREAAERRTRQVDESGIEAGQDHGPSFP